MYWPFKNKANIHVINCNMHYVLIRTVFNYVYFKNHFVEHVQFKIVEK